MKSVLVVDDISDWRSLLKGMIQDEGLECSTASSVDEAIDSLSNGYYDLAILDLRLSEVSALDEGGLDILRWIENSKCETKVIIVSGYLTPDALRRAFKSKILVTCFRKSEVFELLALLKNL